MSRVGSEGSNLVRNLIDVASGCQAVLEAELRYDLYNLKRTPESGLKNSVVLKSTSMGVRLIFPCMGLRRFFGQTKRPSIEYSKQKISLQNI